jgi:hypothetical protein
MSFYSFDALNITNNQTIENIHVQNISILNEIRSGFLIKSIKINVLPFMNNQFNFLSDYFSLTAVNIFNLKLNLQRSGFIEIKNCILVSINFSTHNYSIDDQMCMNIEFFQTEKINYKNAFRTNKKLWFAKPINHLFYGF